MSGAARRSLRLRTRTGGAARRSLRLRTRTGGAARRSLRLRARTRTGGAARRRLRLRSGSNSQLKLKLRLGPHTILYLRNMLESFASHREELARLFHAHKVCRAELFGSAATGTATANSDIDILVTFNSDLEILDYADNYFDLKDKLEALLGRAVDLVSSRSLKNPVLIAAINASKKVLYAA